VLLIATLFLMPGGVAGFLRKTIRRAFRIA
jgi:hypothetical protein